jgi:hypothetical protein
LQFQPRDRTNPHLVPTLRGLENSATLLSWDFGFELISDQAQF